jgi:hypothetical protein
MTSKSGYFKLDALTGIKRSMPREKHDAAKRQLNYATAIYDETRKKAKHFSLLCMITIGVVGFILLFVAVKTPITRTNEITGYTSKDFTTVFYCLVAFILTVIIAIAAYRLLHFASQQKAAADVAGAKRPFNEVINQWPSQVTEAVAHWLLSESGGALERYRLSEDVILFYSPAIITLVNTAAEIAKVIFIRDVREVKLTNPGYKSTSVVLEESESKAGSALRGAIIGDMLVGDDWGAAGAVIGSAGPRKSKSTITENVDSLWAVDVYTKIPNMTVFTQEFGTNGDLAKKFYSVIASPVSSCR